MSDLLAVTGWVGEHPRDGSRGTPEVQIAERAGVARMTVRKALGK